MENKKVKKQVRKTKGTKGKIVPLHTKRKDAEKLAPTVGADLPEPKRKTGIDILGEVQWGTHFCVFYHTKQDLIDILVPYFKAGLENNEFCMWITSEPLSAEDAEKSLSQAVTNLDDYIKKGQIEILDYSDWYTKSEAFEPDRILQGWVQKHDQAVKNGFDGLRVTGNTLWLEKKDWAKFTDYEAVVNSVIGKYKMLTVCTYSLEKCGASEILDAENNHQFSLIKWRGDWKILESSSKNQLEARLAEQTAIAKALERSKKDWAKTFNAMSDWVALIDLKGRILRTNRAGENFTGRTLDEIIGQSCCRLVHGSEKHIPGCPLLKMRETGQQASIELQVPDTDQWLMVTTDPVTDEEGEIIGAVHATRDITERKQAEQSLQEAEAELKHTIEVVPGIIAKANAHTGYFTNCNPALSSILGFSSEEFLARPFIEFIHPDDRQSTINEVEKQFKGSPVARFENRYICKDGAYKWLEWRATAADEKGVVYAAATDITERKRAEEALRKSEEHYRMLAESINDGLAQLDEDGRYVYVNKRHAEIFGCSTNKMVGRHWSEFFDEEARKIIERQLTERRKGKADAYEVKNTTKDDRRIWLRISPQPIFDADGKFRGSIVILTDITECKQAMEQISKLARFPAENPNPVLRVSGYGTVIYGNKAGGPLLKVWQCRTGKSLPAEWHEVVLDALSSGQSQQTEVKCDGRIFSLTFAPVTDANYVNVYGLDITERKKAEKKLLEDQEQLRSMASELSLAEERERRCIAEGLHDEISQPLAFLNIKLDLLKKSTNERSFVDSFSEMKTIIGKLISSARTFTFDLSSPVLSELGLEAGIEDWLNRNIQAKHGIATTFEDDGQIKPLDDDMCGFLFKAVRELLVNVVKHAKASSVKVSIVRDEDKIKIRVEDNGVGFNPAGKKGRFFDPSGYGLFSIHERLNYLRGSFDIESKVGHGTRVTLVAPLKIQGTEVKRGLQ